MIAKSGKVMSPLTIAKLHCHMDHACLMEKALAATKGDLFSFHGHWSCGLHHCLVKYLDNKSISLLLLI